MNCPKCGADNADSALFCGSCGQPLKTADSVSRQNDKEPSVGSPKKLKQKKWPIVLTAVLVIAVAVGGIAAFKINKAQQAEAAKIKAEKIVTVVYQPSGEQTVTKAQIDSATAVLEKRLALLHAQSENISVDYGQSKISVRFIAPIGSADPNSVATKLGAEEKLTLKAPDGSTVLTGEDVKSATCSGSTVHLDFTADGTKKFADATEKYLNQTITIALDKTVLSSARVDMVVTGGKVVISGNNMTAFSAKSIADQISAGYLPFQLNTVSVNIESASSSSKT